MKAIDNTLKPNKTSARDPWQQVRKVFFQKAKFRTSSGIKTMTRVAAYLDFLTTAAAKGDLDAIREKQRFMTYLDRQQILEEQKEVSEGAQAIEKRIADYANFSDQIIKRRSIIYLLIHREVEAQFRIRYSRLKSLDELVPSAIDLERCRPFLLRAQKSARSRAPSASSVGYCKPPVASQWSSGQSGNPSGQRRSKDDAWESFRAGLSKKITVVQDGQDVEMANGELIVRRLFESAMQGKPAARKQLRELLLQLDKRGLAQPFEPVRRKRGNAASSMSDESRIISNEMNYVHARLLRGDIRALLSTRYSAFKDVETSFEIKCRDMPMPHLKEIEALFAGLH
ncbi:MAG: DUF5681 domain-containing protein [Janthinobacterium lividum]